MTLFEPADVCVSIVRSLAEIIPEVTELANSKPNGLPIANTLSPVLTFEELAKLIAFVPLVSLIFNTAISVNASLPINLASTCLEL
ncbi:Uncharacterised protein [Staphylococcus aureus]|nr:Uncharacterised protein [Staphylococcus aureus]